MNEIHRRMITITYDIWQPFDEKVRLEEDAIISMLKVKELLSHAGNVKLTIEEKE